MGHKVIFLNNESNVSQEKTLQNPDEYNLGIDKLKQTIDDTFDDHDEKWRKKINVIKIEKLENNCRGKFGACEYVGSQGYKKKFKLFYGDDDDINYCYEKAKKLKIVDDIKDYNEKKILLNPPCDDDIPCDGFWSACTADADGVYKKQWTETRPLNGSGSCQDKYGNDISSIQESGCGSGSGSGVGYDNKNILKKCNPNNDDDDDNSGSGPFLIDGSYFENGSDGERIYVDVNNGSTTTGSNALSIKTGDKIFGSNTEC